MDMENLQKSEFRNVDVMQVYQAWPAEMREKIYVLRQMIFDVAASTEGVGNLVETLKWNVPAYLTEKPKSGTTLRLQGNVDAGQYGLYVPCTTNLIEQCKELYPEIFNYTKNRGILFDLTDQIPKAELRHFIAMALTYHVKSGPKK